MDNKKIKEAYIDNLIALCHILDDYSEFNKNLSNLISTKYNRNDVYYLYEISNGKFMVGTKKVKQFYKKNKVVVDIINKYSDISQFINRNYDCKGKPIESSGLDFFYQYILDNKKDLEKILAVLNKIKELGFDNLKFDENLNFTNTEYQIETKFSHNFNVEYLDNIEIMPNYQRHIVKYKTADSNYKIIILPSFNEEISIYFREIIVNSLTFDANRLPESITKKNIFDKIINLANDKKDECAAIRTSVDLSMSLDSLSSNFDSTNNLLSRIDDIENKDELLKILSEIQLNLSKLKSASTNYNNRLSDKYSIPEETLQKEKKLYLERQYWSNIDID